MRRLDHHRKVRIRSEQRDRLDANRIGARHRSARDLELDRMRIRHLRESKTNGTSLELTQPKKKNLNQRETQTH